MRYGSPLLSAALALSGAVCAAQPESYPTRPIRMIIGFTAGTCFSTVLRGVE